MTDAVENDKYTKFVSRIIRRLGERVAEGDVEGVALLFVDLPQVLKEAQAVAVVGLLGFGYSHGEIGSRMGRDRQAVHQWLQRNPPSTPR